MPVAVHLAAVTASVRVVIDRVLYLPKDWAADEERREVVGVPEEIMFATKLQQTSAMVENALELGVQTRWFAGDEVYSAANCAGICGSSGSATRSACPTHTPSRMERAACGRPAR